MTADGARFTLDEPAARDWITRAMTQHEGQSEGEPDDSLPEIGPDYCAAQDDESGHDTFELVLAAYGAGIIADAEAMQGRALSFEFMPGGTDRPGYEWCLFTGPPGELIVSSGFAELNGLGGGPDIRGTESALEVLREAVNAGNALADGLDRYVTAQPIAARAPEIGQLASRLPRGGWGADELETLETWLLELGHSTE